MEQIWGPVRGFYIAAYAAPLDDSSRYCSYAKVCFTRPASYWEASGVLKVFGGDAHASAEEALSSVHLNARNQIVSLPPETVTLLECLRRPWQARPQSA